MKVLWIVNLLFPEVCKKRGFPEPVVGGWLYSYKQVIVDYCSDIELHVVSPYEGSAFLEDKVDNISFYAFPKSVSDDELGRIFVNLKNKISPDVVHIHGSEYKHSCLYVKYCGGDNVVLSIQGMIGVYANYLFSGLDRKRLKKAFSIRDFLKKERITDLYRDFVRRGKYESFLIENISNVIGRTSWDFSHCKAINGDIKFHTCQEPLRKSFYENKWELEKCEKNSIFLSQVNYPIKGFHIFLMGLSIVKKYYPDVKVYISGYDLTKKPWYRISTYWLYIKKLISDLNLGDTLFFLGPLTEEEMVVRYTKANVFICPSSIENSSNSICEAQILGTPVIASYVGGTMDLILDGESGIMYRFEEYEMLAQKIINLFSNDALANRISEKSRKVAMERHCRKTIANTLKSIYEDVLIGEKNE